MKKHNFRNLQIYQRSIAFSVETYKIFYCLSSVI
jgi:hypothetical protein